MKSINGSNSTAVCGVMSTTALHPERIEGIGAQAASIAHDLNNVLTAVLVSTRMLRDQLSEEEDVALLDVAESGSHRAADLTRQLLKFARGTEGKSTRFSPRVVIGEIGRMLRATFPPPIQLQEETQDVLWAMQGDPTQLHRVLLNLCVNARDAMPRGGALSLRASNLEIKEGTATGDDAPPAGRYVKIEVSDTGTGIAPEIRERIFEPFFTTKGIGKGTGLGLFAVKTIVESHGGRLECESEIGRGTTIRILFPAQASAEETADLRRGCGELILVVDDEETLRDVARMTLERFGYRVITAEDGAAGLALFADHRHEIALVLSDHNMPIMDGSAMLLAIHQLSPEMRVVTASGHPAEEHVLRTDEGYAHMTINKPWTAESLIGAVSAVLDAEVPQS